MNGGRQPKEILTFFLSPLDRPLSRSQQSIVLLFFLSMLTFSACCSSPSPPFLPIDRIHLLRSLAVFYLAFANVAPLKVTWLSGSGYCCATSGDHAFKSTIGIKQFELRHHHLLTRNFQNMLQNVLPSNTLNYSDVLNRTFPIGSTFIQSSRSSNLTVVSDQQSVSAFTFTGAPPHISRVSTSTYCINRPTFFDVER